VMMVLGLSNGVGCSLLVYIVLLLIIMTDPVLSRGYSVLLSP